MSTPTSCTGRLEFEGGRLRGAEGYLCDRSTQQGDLTGCMIAAVTDSVLAAG